MFKRVFQIIILAICFITSPLVIQHAYGNSVCMPYESPYGPVNKLLELLKSPKPSERVIAVTELSKIWNEDVRHEMRKCLKDDVFEVRYAAAKSLLFLKSRLGLPVIIEGLKHKEQCFDAAVTLCELGDQSGLYVFIEELESKDPNACREVAAEMLYYYGDKSSVPTLIKFVLDSNSSVRNSVIHALGEIGDEAAVPALMSLLKSDSTLRSYALSSLKKIGKPAVVPLLKAFKKYDKEIQIDILNSISDIGYVSSVPMLIPLLNEENQDKLIRWRIIQALQIITGEKVSGRLEEWKKWWAVNGEHLIANEEPRYNGRSMSQWLNAPYSWPNRDVIMALKRIGKPVVPKLIKALAIKNIAVGQGVGLVFREFGEQGITELAKAIYSKTEYVRLNAIDAFEMIGKSAIPALVKIANDEKDIIARTAAIMSLGKIQDQSAIPALKEMYKNADEEIRLSIIRALVSIGGEEVLAFLNWNLLNEKSPIVRDSIAWGKQLMTALSRFLLKH